MDLDIELLEEAKNIANLIRKENTDENMVIYTNSYAQIIIEKPISHIETITSFSDIMTEMRYIHSRYMPNFEATMELCMTRASPLIYCCYERIQDD